MAWYMSEFTIIDGVLNMSHTIHCAMTLYQVNEYLLKDGPTQNPVKVLRCSFNRFCKTRYAEAATSVKKSISRYFAKFIGKYLCQSLVFNKVAGLRPATLFQKSLLHRCFPVNFVKFPRTHFLTEHLQGLYLPMLNLWESSEYVSGFKFFNVLNIPGLSISHSSEFLELHRVYYFHRYDKVLNMQLLSQGVNNQYGKYFQVSHILQY